MGYSINLNRILISDFKSIIMSKDLLPSRKCLLDDIDLNFNSLENYGLFNLHQLKTVLSNPKKLAALANKTRISSGYLTILKREVSALEQSPVPLKAFDILDETVIKEMEACGIRSSRDYFERINDKSLPDNTTADTLAFLCDLVRVNGIGAAAARAFLAAGYKSVNDVANSAAGEMLERVSYANSIHGYYKASLGEKDMQYCIDNAQLLLRFSD